jgi:hypothetical protein
MAPPIIHGVSGIGADRPSPGVDMAAEARQRQAERLRAEQAETTDPAKVVENAAKAEAPTIPPQEQIQPYRVQLDPDTHRLYTEVLDTSSGDVIMRIPPNYAGPADPADPIGEEQAGKDDGDAPGQDITA